MKRSNWNLGDAPDLTETRVHILTAGKELLCAARGALSFCSKFVENSGTSAPNVAEFFKKAMVVAEDLSSGLSVEGIKKAAQSATRPIFTIMEQEMTAEKGGRIKAARAARAARTATGRVTTATKRTRKKS